MDLNFQAVVSRVCFGSLTSLVEDKLLGTYWGCTFPVGLVFLFLKQCLMQVKPHSTAVSSFPPKGDGCFSSAIVYSAIPFSGSRNVYSSVIWKGLPG